MLNKKSLVTRTLTGIVLVGITVAAVYAGGGYTAAFLWIIMNAGLAEWNRLQPSDTGKGTLFDLFLTANTVYFLIVGWLYTRTGVIRMEAVRFFLWFSVLLAVRSMGTYIFKADTARRMSSVWGGVVYVGLPMALLNFLSADFHPDGGHVLMGFFLIIWANDIFAYLIGSWLGRHKLCERLSPAKTWEGAVGGFLCAVVLGGLWGWFLLSGVRGGLWILLCVLIPISAVLGDLFESKLKRDAQVKDSGNFLPGHGGILDRYDSVFFAAPVAVALWQLLQIFT